LVPLSRQEGGLAASVGDVYDASSIDDENREDFGDVTHDATVMASDNLVSDGSNSESSLANHQSVSLFVSQSAISE